jgi:hypothetical protein
MSILNAITSGAGGVALSGDTSGNLTIQSAGTNVASFVITGDVGIGTNTPTAGSGFTTSRRTVQIAGGAAGNAQIHLGGTSGTILDHNDDALTVTTLRNLYGALNAGAQMQLQSGFISFGTRTSYTEAMRIDSSGRTLIGTISVGYINGYQMTVAHSVTGGAAFKYDGTSETNAISLQNGNGQVGRIYTSNSNTTYATSSDYRLKENIAPMTGALDKVTQLKPVTYKWKSDGTDGQGFIAHELAEICPDCVGGIKDGVDEEGNPVYQDIDTSFLVATLTAAIQELKAEVDSLKQQLGK